MRKAAFLAVLLGSLALAACDNAPRLPQGTEDVFFVSSEKELAIALAQKDTLKGLAVSVNFYNSTTAENQGNVDKIVRYIISLELRPVYLYGQPFDRGLAQRLLIDEDGSGCTPTAFAGLFPRKGDPGLMCGADDNPRTEAKFREWILNHWKSEKKFFLRNKE